MKERPTATLLVFVDQSLFDVVSRISWNLDMGNGQFVGSYRLFETVQAAVASARRAARKWGLEITGVEGVSDQGRSTLRCQQVVRNCSTVPLATL